MENYRIILSQEQIQERVKELGAQITEEYKRRRLFFRRFNKKRKTSYNDRLCEVI